MSTRTVLFYRDFSFLTGGDLKVWDYFNHVLASPSHNALAHFSAGSVWDDSNPWSNLTDHVVKNREHVDADVIFLSGLDWLQLEPAQRENSSLPIINLVQHVWHACPNDPLGRYHFLGHKAIRICVSPEVTRALDATGRVRGPLITIRDGIDFDALAKASKSSRDIDLLIVASKARAPTPGSPAAPGELGPELKTKLNRPGRRIHLIESRVQREELLHWLGRSAVTLFLPNRKEGFYLPALEGMALGTIVVCPDCIGNRSFCLAGRNCFRPRYEVGELVEAVEAALANRASLGDMIDQASRTAREHDLGAERAAFLDVLNQVDAIWERI